MPSLTRMYVAVDERGADPERGAQRVQRARSGAGDDEHEPAGGQRSASMRRASNRSRPSAIAAAATIAGNV